DADSHIKMIQLIASLIESDIVTFLQGNGRFSPATLHK
ncbi:hypothetical protein VBQ34_22560, partial [Klebsiella pneumoniae]|nr:hypothetical protein [Klebsiella pneumoniae]